MRQHPVTPARKAFAEDLGAAIARVIDDHPKISLDEIVAVQAQLLGAGIKAAYPQDEWSAMTEVVTANMAQQMKGIQ
jgi:hypothetical protein